MILLTGMQSACAPVHITSYPQPTYDPFEPITQNDNQVITNDVILTDQPTQTPSGPTPTRVPVEPTLHRTADPNSLLDTPTPDLPHVQPTPRRFDEHYIVRPGDTLGALAEYYGLNLDTLIEANNILDPSSLEVGTDLIIPAPEAGDQGPGFKIIPDSELVFSPSNALFNVDGFITNQPGYLSSYSEDINGEILTGSEIIDRVAQNYSINPRLLLAILEHQSKWVTDPDPDELLFPIGKVDSFRTGLYLQLTWTANALNRGYYLWRVNGLPGWSFSDGKYATPNPNLNAGTAAVQNFFADLDDSEKWSQDVGGIGLFLSYWVLFGNPFNYAYEPVLPEGLEQPSMNLPFESGEIWSFTGGPHGGWDSGSSWAALDFAPPGDTSTCLASGSWVTAIADGLILRASNGAVLQDLDNDGYEQTGWTVLYMHIDSYGRIQPGQYIYAGNRIGHPSCEGGLANGTHVHLARRYNGEWIPADGAIPFILDGWESEGNGIEYDGYLKRDEEMVEAWDGVLETNQITR
jgi:murein DD-endopeptidase MepM/ murein hydrolase activator NlpD